MKLYTTDGVISQSADEMPATAGSIAGGRRLAARVLEGLSGICGLLPLLLGGAVLAMTAACFILMLVGTVGPVSTLATLNCVSIGLIIAMDYVPLALRAWARRVEGQ